MLIVETLKRRKRRFYKALVLGLSISLLTSFASTMGYLEGLETKALDFLLWLRGQQKSPEIVIVQIDDQAFRNLGEKQPLPRSYLAGLIEVIGRGGAKVIGVDIELKVPTNPLDDEALVRAIQAVQENGISKAVPVYLIRPEKEQDGGILYTRTPFFSQKLAVVAGFANAAVESDGFVRQIPLAVKAGDGKILLSLALAVLARHAGYDAARLEQAVNQGSKPVLLLPEWDKLNGALRPGLTPFSFQLEDSWKINFAGAQGSFKAIPSDPVFQLSKIEVPLAEDNPFRNKIVLIGATFSDSREFFPTPKGLMSGIEIHANIIHTLLSRSQILPAQRLLALVISLIFAVVMSLVLTLLRPSLVNILSFAAIPVLLVPSYWVFVRYGLWVDFVTPLLAIRWGAYMGDYLESRHVRKSLGEYVDREVANQIIDQEETIRSQKKEVTVFFTDVRNFTTLSERLPPEKIVGIINELFATTGKIIARHQGCIVDFIGDAILAVFGAPKDNPNHALDAVQTAIEVQKELDGLNEKWQKRGIPAIQTGVGIHTGEVLAGIVGSGERKKFGITGDTVNTGSRVEALNKEFSTSILITRETLEKTNGKIEARSRGQVKVKGKENPVEVFEVLIPGRTKDAIEEAP
jgi:adenylate cyclase